jgi:hypothetical protein
MLGSPRIKRRRWMPLAAMLAVAVAADPRLTHLAFCPISPSVRSELRADCSDDEVCCSTGSCSHSQAVDNTCFAIGSCSCCSHVPPGHQGEPDARSIYVSSAPLKAELGAATPSFPPLVDAPPSAFRLPTPSHRAATYAPLELLCNHLLI